MRSELVFAVALAFAACKPAECEIDAELFDVKVTATCALDDDEYDCECTVGKTELESFGSDDVCALSEDEQKAAVEKRCAPELDDCIVIHSANGDFCNADYSCGLLRNPDRGVSVGCDGTTCVCHEDTDREDDDFTGKETGDFAQGTFCDLVAAWDGGDDDAEAEVNVLIAKGCGLDDADF